jgi:replicative superfamily II helicase
MRISARPEAREMRKGVRLVIIDEIHALRSRQGPISGGSLEASPAASHYLDR